MTEEKYNQTERIKRRLKSGLSITPIEALNLFGCFRLSARILEIRQEGFDVQTELVQQGNKRFARYSLKQKS